MIKTPLIILLLFAHGVYAQKTTEDFHITLPERKVAHSLYNQIAHLDSRHDTSNMGIVQLGAFNRKAEVIPKKHLSLQLTEVLQALSDTSAQEGKLLFQLRHFNFAETIGGTSERGYCYLRAELYSTSNEVYKKIGTIDTVIYVKSLDVTRGLFRRASKLIADFIAIHLTTKPADNAVAYMIGDVKNIDRIEKRLLPLYVNDSFIEGLYLSYQSFADQTPEHQAVVEMQGKKISSVRIKGPDGKPVKLKAWNVFAIVHNGTPYVSTDYGYYPLLKRENDFYFIGKAKIGANSNDVITAGIFFGILGSVMASNATTTFEMKLDHLNGGFIRIKEANYIRAGERTNNPN